MAFTQRDVQQSIQSQLPVVPNNGNPGGAYNMQQVASAEPVPTNFRTSPNPFQWVEPSEYMENIRYILDRQMKELADPVQQAYNKGNLIPSFNNGQMGYIATDDTGVPVAEESFITIDPYGDLPQLQSNPALPSGTVLPIRANGQ